MLKNLSLILSCCVFLCCGHTDCHAKQSETEDTWATTIDRLVLFCGLPDKKEMSYDSSKLTQEQIEQYTTLGLSELAARFELANKENNHAFARGCAVTLCCWYLNHGDRQESFQWALKAADHGSAYGMMELSISYINGTGVNQDLIEGAKWLYLGAAGGDDFCKDMVKKAKKSRDKEVKACIAEGKKRATAWRQAHKDLSWPKV